MHAKVEAKKLKFVLTNLKKWWQASQIKRVAHRVFRLIIGNGRFFLAANLRRALIEAELLALLIFLLASNNIIVPDYRLITIAYLPGVLLATFWLAIRLAKSKGQFIWDVLLAGLLLGVLLVSSAFLLSLLNGWRLEELASVNSPDLLNIVAPPPSNGLQFFLKILLFFVAGPEQFSATTPLFLVFSVRFLFYSLEIGLGYCLLRLGVLLLAIPAGWLKRLGERKLRWRLTFSHFWVVVVSLAAAIAGWAIFFGLLNFQTDNQPDFASRQIAASHAQSLALAIAQEQQLNGRTLAASDLENVLKLVNQQNLANNETLQKLQTGQTRPVQALLQRLAKSRLNEADFLVITDLQGLIIASSQPERFPSGSNFSADGADNQSWQQLITQAASGEQNLARLSLTQAYPNILIAGAYPVIGTDGKIAQIVLVAERPVLALTTAVQPLAPLLFLGVVFVLAGLFTSVFSLLVALFFGYFLSRRLLANLEQLEQATDALAQGQLEEQVNIRAEDEIGRLANRFNLMARRLKESQASLSQEKQKAEEALQTKRELVANVSHELRTPVSTIRAHIEWLLMNLEAQPQLLEQKQYLEIVERETERLSSMIEDLLDLSKIEGQGLQVAPEPVAVAEVATEVKHRLGVLAQRERKLTLTLDVASNLPMVMADRLRLEQVLVNLTRNAINYTPVGGIISIGAEVEEVESAETWVRLWVADTGIGIPAEDLAHIFERFYRRDASRSRHTGGAGLGLAIVKVLVEAMGGRVEVESVVGEGSRFSIILRAA